MVARKAMVGGQMRAGDPFPSSEPQPRAEDQSQHRAQGSGCELLSAGLIEVRVGVGTIVAELPSSTASERSQLMKQDLEKIVVEARQLGLELDDVLDAVVGHWERLAGQSAGARGGRRRS